MRDILPDQKEDELMRLQEQMQLAAKEQVIGMVSHYEAHREGRAEDKDFWAYFVSGNEMHDLMRGYLDDELGIRPHPSNQGIVITADGVELSVVEQRDEQTGSVYGVTYSTINDPNMPWTGGPAKLGSWVSQVVEA